MVTLNLNTDNAINGIFSDSIAPFINIFSLSLAFFSKKIEERKSNAEAEAKAKKFLEEECKELSENDIRKIQNFVEHFGLSFEKGKMFVLKNKCIC
jgi:hypothetical protein